MTNYIAVSITIIGIALFYIAIIIWLAQNRTEWYFWTLLIIGIALIIIGVIYWIIFPDHPFGHGKYIDEEENMYQLENYNTSRPENMYQSENYNTPRPENYNTPRPENYNTPRPENKYWSSYIPNYPNSSN